MENVSKVLTSNEQIQLKLTELDIKSMDSINCPIHLLNQNVQKNPSNNISLTYTISLEQIPIEIQSKNIYEKVNYNSVKSVYQKKDLTTKMINIQFDGSINDTQSKYTNKFLKRSNKISKLIQIQNQDSTKTIEQIYGNSKLKGKNNNHASLSTHIDKYGERQRIGINYTNRLRSQIIRKRKCGIFRKSNLVKQKQNIPEVQILSLNTNNKINLSSKKLLEELSVPFLQAKINHNNIDQIKEGGFLNNKTNKNIVFPEFQSIVSKRNKINSQRIYLQASKYQQRKNKQLLNKRNSEHQPSKLRDSVQGSLKNLLINSNQKLAAYENLSEINNRKNNRKIICQSAMNKLPR